MMIGFYGKTAARGDFVGRGLPREFVDCWDAWLTEELHTMGLHRPDWKAEFNSAPPWRFVIGQGVCGNDRWAGVVVPSRDRVGRNFPFVVAASFDKQIQLGTWFRDTSDWYDQIEGLAKTSSIDDFDPSGMDVTLARLSAPLQGEGLTLTESQFEPTKSTRYTFSWMEDLEDAAFPPGNESAEKMVLGEQCTLFWAERTKTASAQLITSHGLPKGQSFRNLYLLEPDGLQPLEGGQDNSLDLER
jgi:type VI secretion system protein ImpM